MLGAVCLSRKYLRKEKVPGTNLWLTLEVMSKQELKTGCLVNRYPLKSGRHKHKTFQEI